MLLALATAVGGWLAPPPYELPGCVQQYAMQLLLEENHKAMQAAARVLRANADMLEEAAALHDEKEGSSLRFGDTQSVPNPFYVQIQDTEATAATIDNATRVVEAQLAAWRPEG